MFPQEPVYDLDLLARHNGHVHTSVSGCADAEMTVENIVQTAAQAGLETIALVDHHHESIHDILADLERLKSELIAVNTDVDVLVGAELSAYGPDDYSLTKADSDRIEYRMYATNHYHLSPWNHPEEISPRAYAEHGLETLRRLIPSGRAHCIAHPLVGTYLQEILEDYTQVGASITDDELGEILELGKIHDVAFDVNYVALRVDPEFSRRMWDLGKEVGARMLVGTDAHTLDRVDPRKFLKTFRSVLER